jgi:glycosyltransferase involved in cell wall biosynthesis
MLIHIISTANGEENEGMRNVATHITHVLEQNNRVIHSSLHDLFYFPMRCWKANCTIIFARCISKVYDIIRICSLFTKNIFIVLVQRPDKYFLWKCQRHPLSCHYFTVCKEDVSSLTVHEGYGVFGFSIGMNIQKFCPVTQDKKEMLRNKYGLDPKKPVVVHVGHCSAGRGLEDFRYINTEVYQCIVVASGMFDNDKVKVTLNDIGVKLITGYMKNVNEIYQLADVYFFPTQNDEFVISVPLSVMEALSCGIPVLAYKSFEKLRNISSVPDGIYCIHNAKEINQALVKLTARNNDISLLSNPKTWEEAASEFFQTIEGVVNKL